MAHQPAEPRLRLRAMHDLLDRYVHQSAVEHCRIVAAAAPFGRLGADGVLHVLNAFAIPLIVERRKMVRRTEPLVVYVLVTALAGVGLHEEFAGNFSFTVDLGRAREERTLRAITFAAHVSGRHRGILNPRDRKSTRLNSSH